nr:glycoside hydrolase family 2 TIM barrel-domain containing protein [Tissierella sp.]
MKKIDINFDWQYSPDFKEEYIEVDFDDRDFVTVNIPHSNIEIPYNNFDEKIYQFESCYRKKLRLDSFDEEESVYIKFEGVMTFARVYLNAICIGEHKGGYTPFRLDLTDVAIGGHENILVVYVDSRERKDIPPFGFVIDYLSYGGIYREVALEYRNKTHIETVGIKTNDLLTKSPKLEIDLYFKNIYENIQFLNLKCSLIEAESTIYEFEKTLEINEELNQVLTIKEAIEGKCGEELKLWSLDNPNLYRLKLDLIKEGRIIDSQNISFGFREIEFRSEGFYLNGKHIKIQGLNRHQSFPYVGNAMPKSAQYKDADILKYELGVNMVRLSHYPQSNHFLDRCDQIGLLVFDEIPGWQHVGDESWQEISVENVREMILKDMNHPSIVIWGVRINESQDYDKFYKKTNDMAHKLDSSRPTGGVRNIAKSNILEDVYTYNDFVHTGENLGLQKKSKVTKTDKPYLVTEYNGHMFPTKKFDNESRRVEHALRHLNVLEAMQGDKDISGSIGWCMFDYNTHKDFGSGDKICYHGVMDMYRIPKHAAFAYGSQQDDYPIMHVASSLNIGEYDGSLLEDIYVFTNCDSIKLYKNGEYVNTFYPDREKYPNLVNAPIRINDLIGDAIEKNEKFSKGDAGIVKDILINVNKNGLKLRPVDTAKMGWIFLKYKMNMADAEDLYTRYFGGWGGEATSYEFKGYKGEKSILKLTKGQVVNPRLDMKIDSNILIEEATYDTTRVVLRLLDDYGNDIIYANDTVTIEAQGGVEVIGPKVLALIGGSIGFWIKSKGESGQANIKIISERFGVLEKKIEVIKNRL